MLLLLIDGPGEEAVGCHFTLPIPNLSSPGPEEEEEEEVVGGAFTAEGAELGFEAEFDLPSLGLNESCPSRAVLLGPVVFVFGVVVVVVVVNGVVLVAEADDKRSIDESSACKSILAFSTSAFLARASASSKLKFETFFTAAPKPREARGREDADEEALESPELIPGREEIKPEAMEEDFVCGERAFSNISSAGVIAPER